MKVPEFLLPTSSDEDENDLRPGETIREIRFSFGVKWSILVHLAIASIVLIKTVVFPDTSTPYIPALKVDLVGLPDVLKKDMDRMGKVASGSKANETAKPKPKPKKEKTIGLKKKKTRAKKKRKAKMDNALARIRAMDKIREAELEAPDQIKGNQISKGSALSGQAQENAASTYYDAVLLKLKDNWALPVWLARQNLSAQAIVYIQKSGKLKGLVISKSSGNLQFDNQVRTAIERSAPFPPIPDDAGLNLADGILLGFPL